MYIYVYYISPDSNDGNAALGCTICTIKNKIDYVMCYSIKIKLMWKYKLYPI